LVPFLRSFGLVYGSFVRLVPTGHGSRFAFVYALVPLRFCGSVAGLLRSGFYYVLIQFAVAVTFVLVLVVVRWFGSGSGCSFTRSAVRCVRLLVALQFRLRVRGSTFTFVVGLVYTFGHWFFTVRFADYYRTFAYHVWVYFAFTAFAITAHLHAFPFYAR